MQKIRAFTVSYENLSNVLSSPVGITVDSTLKSNISNLSFNAIWDTGATQSAIDSKIVEDLGLTPIDVINVSTAGSIERCFVYKINIILPNQVTVLNIRVTGVNIRFIDALIGMDIINLGDFAITNNKGKTCFTFRIPSSHAIDFVKEAKYEGEHR